MHVIDHLVWEIYRLTLIKIKNVFIHCTLLLLMWYRIINLSFVKSNGMHAHGYKIIIKKCVMMLLDISKL